MHVAWHVVGLLSCIAGLVGIVEYKALAPTTTFTTASTNATTLGTPSPFYSVRRNPLPPASTFVSSPRCTRCIPLWHHFPLPVGPARRARHLRLWHQSLVVCPTGQGPPVPRTRRLRDGPRHVRPRPGRHAVERSRWCTYHDLVRLAHVYVRRGATVCRHDELHTRRPRPDGLLSPVGLCPLRQLHGAPVAGPGRVCADAQGVTSRWSCASCFGPLVSVHRPPSFVPTPYNAPANEQP